MNTCLTFPLPDINKHTSSSLFRVVFVSDNILRSPRNITLPVKEKTTVNSKFLPTRYGSAFLINIYHLSWPTDIGECLSFTIGLGKQSVALGGNPPNATDCWETIQQPHLYYSICIFEIRWTRTKTKQHWFANNWYECLVISNSFRDKHTNHPIVEIVEYLA